MASLNTLELPIPNTLDELQETDAAKIAKMKKWELQFKQREEQRDIYMNFLAGFYALIWGQCTVILRDKLRGHQSFEAIEQSQDGLALLKLIKTITHTYDDAKICQVDALNTYRWKYTTMRKQPGQSLGDFYDQFQAHVHLCVEMGMQLYEPALAENIRKVRGGTVLLDTDKKEAHDKSTAMQFIRACGYTNYLNHLRNSFLDGHDLYPRTLADAFTVMDQRTTSKHSNNHNPNHTSHPNFSNTANCDTSNTTHTTMTTNTTTGMAYPTSTVVQDQPSTHSNISQPSGACQLHTVVTYGTALTCHALNAQASPSNSLPKGWILLDNQATADIFGNADLLADIRPTTRSLYIHGITGVCHCNMEGYLPGYGWVWYCKDVNVNVLSLSQMKKQYLITYNSIEGKFKVSDFQQESIKYIFQESNEGLHYHDTTQHVHITTVKENQEKYSQTDIRRANKVKQLQRTIGYPTSTELRHILNHHALPNCPFTSRDVQIAEAIHGKDLGNIKGKTTRTNPPKVTGEVIPCPHHILQHYNNITLVADVMYVNGIPFFVTKSRHIMFGTINALPSNNDINIIGEIHRIQGIYQQRGLHIHTILMDGAFSQLAANGDLHVTVNTTSRDEHVGDIERYIHTIKERMRCRYNTLPFQRMPRIMIIELAKATVYWLNSVPHNLGVSKILSPRTIVTGTNIDYNKHCEYEFGEYVQTHEEHDNTMAARTVGAIALRPTGNQQGGYWFMSLLSGRILNRIHATKVPMPAEVIHRLQDLADNQDVYPELAFGNRDNRLIMTDITDDEEDQDAYMPSIQDDETLRYDNSETMVHDADQDAGSFNPLTASHIIPQQPDISNQLTEHDRTNDDIEIHSIPTMSDMTYTQSEQPIEQDLDDGHHASLPTHQEQAGEEEPLPTHQEQAGEDEPDIETQAEESESTTHDQNDEELHNDKAVQDTDHELEQRMNEQYGARTTRWNLRARKQHNYEHKYGTDADIYLTKSELYDPNVATPQMSMRQGLKLFCEGGVQAVKAELNQLHQLKVIRGKKLSPTQQKEALGYLMFLKRKRGGKIKGRGCANGRPQRLYIPREDAMSPTVATESVFLTALIDAKEQRFVAIVDVPGAFMQADMDPGVYMRINGKMAMLLLEIDHEMYSPYVVMEKGKKVIYVELLKALYGTLRAARLFWELMSRKLQEWGFTINPYDSCVANKQINGSQCTITWHVDDLKISHVKENCVKQVITWMKKEFGQQAELTIQYGPVVDYLGMILDFSTPGILTVDMSEYIKMILRDIPDHMRGSSSVPANKSLFTTRDTIPTLDTATQEFFHYVTMQLMYLSQRGRPDIRTAVAYLSSRVTKPNQDDLHKLSKVVKYLESTIDLPLRLQALNDGILDCWIDAAYGAHDDCKGHTGTTMSLGHGSIYSNSIKQKLVARSSTEAELIGTHDVLPQVLWTKNFLTAQGFTVQKTNVYQDNLSAMLLENNGRQSSTKRTKHIHMRYFYITDHVKQQSFQIHHCPTLEMLADFFTKPLQGKLFYRFRDGIMNIAPESKFHSSHRSVLHDHHTHPGVQSHPSGQMATAIQT